MRAYSTDLRERLVRAVASGQPMSVVARQFSVSCKTVKRMVQLQAATGAVKRRPIPGGPRQIDSDHEGILRSRLHADPDATVVEQCAWWQEHEGQQVSEATMWRAMRRLGWTHKKNDHSK